MLPFPPFFSLIHAFRLVFEEEGVCLTRQWNPLWRSRAQRPQLMQHLQSADYRTGMVSNIWPELHHVVCTITLSSGYIMVIITTIIIIIITSIIIIPFSYLISFIFIIITTTTSSSSPSSPLLSSSPSPPSSPTATSWLPTWLPRPTTQPAQRETDLEDVTHSSPRKIKMGSKDWALKS